MVTAVATLTTATFDDEVLNVPRPMLVDFWSEACEPCKAMLPVLEEIALECAGTLRVATAKLDDASDLATRFVFTNGAPRRPLNGTMGKDRLLEELAEFLR